MGGWAMLGASTDMIGGMIAEGYDPSLVNSLSAAGATDAQLQRLWDTTAPGSQDFTIAANNLQQQLTGRPGATGGGGYPSAAIPTTISTAFGVYDLTQQAAWDTISGQFTQTQQQLNALARSAPKDADVIQMVTDFNSLVGQYANYYYQAFGSAPLNIPLASFPTMSGLGIAPLVILGGIAVAVAAILATLYLLNQRIVAKAALIQSQGASQTTANVGSLSQTYQQQIAAMNAAYAAGNKTLGDQLAAQASQTALAIQKVGAAPAAAGTMDFAAWFQQNWGWLMLGLGAMIIIPSAMGRRR
jgi:hypothetical protein